MMASGAQEATATASILGEAAQPGLVRSYDCHRWTAIKVAVRARDRPATGMASHVTARRGSFEELTGNKSLAPYCHGINLDLRDERLVQASQ
jgi:hypothetical protein